MKDQKDKEKSNAGRKNSDRLTVISDTTHQPDRDQIFSSDSRRHPSGEQLLGEKEWEGDLEEQVKGDRNWNVDAAEEIRMAGGLSSRPDVGEGFTEDPAPLDTEVTEFDPVNMSDEELRAMADVRGVADPMTMTRRELVHHLQEASGS